MAYSPDETHTFLDNEISSQGVRFRLVPIARINDLKISFEDTLTNKINDPDFEEFIRNINWYGALKTFPEAKSILIASAFNPAYKVIFQTSKGDIEAVIPPGFVGFYPRQGALRRLVTDTLASHNYKAERILLPIKLLAVKCGLAEYGRNNISYVGDFGSFHFLGAFLTDLPARDDFWREEVTMPECTDCELCRLNCPSKAIGEDRFLLHGEKCITLYNENPGEFPQWIKPEWHHALIGCIRCQEVCPRNKQAYKEIKLLETFTIEETETICKETDFELLPEAIKKKFDQFGFAEHHPEMIRNIRALCLKNL